MKITVHYNNDVLIGFSIDRDGPMLTSCRAPLRFAALYMLYMQQTHHIDLVRSLAALFTWNKTQYQRKIIKLRSLINTYQFYTFTRLPNDTPARNQNYSKAVDSITYNATALRKHRANIFRQCERNNDQKSDQN